MPAEYVPTTEEVREMVRKGYLDPRDLDFDDVPGQAFDRWLADHDATLRKQVRAEVAREIRDYARRVNSDPKYGHDDEWVRLNLHPDHLARLAEGTP